MKQISLFPRSHTLRTAKAHQAWSSALQRFIVQLLSLLCVSLLISACSQGASGQTVPTPPKTPLDDLVVNDFIPFDFCTWFYCNWYLGDSKTGWKRSDFQGDDFGLDQDSGEQCNPGWTAFSCTIQRSFIRPKREWTLQKPTLDDVGSNGVTFALRVLTNPRRNDEEEGTIISMSGVFSIKTIGRRWALHTEQKAPDGSGTGYDETPWEPYNYDGNVNLYEDLYYTFTPDGKVRIDKFTPYIVFPQGTAGYTWEESTNDSGWPVLWENGTRRFVSTGTLTLGELGGGGPNGLDAFRELKVYRQALTLEQMRIEEDFYHFGALERFKTIPCNTGTWMNDTDSSITPCGNVGGRFRDATGKRPENITGFNLSTDSFAPSLAVTATGSTYSLSIGPPPSYPPASVISDAGQASPNYPVTPQSYLLRLSLQDANGLHECIQESASVPASFPTGGTLVGATVYAEYPNFRDKPGASATWLNPGNPTTAPQTTLSIPGGWSCTAVKAPNYCGGPITENCVPNPGGDHDFAQKILFVGDSYTFGRLDPVMSYNASGVNDLTTSYWVSDQTGTNSWEPHPWGGIPGIFKKMTDEAGLNYDVSISARNAASLRGQFLDIDGETWDLRGNVASQKWDEVVFQENTTKALPLGKGKNADPLVFQAYAKFFEQYVHVGKAMEYSEADVFGFKPGQVSDPCQGTTLSAGSCTKERTIPANPNANPNAKVYLMQTPARPDMVFAHQLTKADPATPNGYPVVDTTETGGPSTLYYTSLSTMTKDLHDAFFSEVNSNSGFAGVIAVGDAFQSALDAGLARSSGFYDGNGLYVPAPDGTMDLWWDDGLHPRTFGAYLEALVTFGKITGKDPVSLGASEGAAVDLGISTSQAQDLQRLASFQLGFRNSLSQ